MSDISEIQQLEDTLQQYFVSLEYEIKDIQKDIKKKLTIAMTTTPIASDIFYRRTMHFECSVPLTTLAEYKQQIEKSLIEILKNDGMEHDNGSVVKHLQSLKNQIIDYESTLKNLKNKQFFDHLLSKGSYLEHIYYIERLRYDKFYGRQNIMGIEFVSTEQIDVYIKKLEDELVRKFGASFLQRVETKKQKLFGIDGVFTQDANLQRFLMVIKQAYGNKKIPITSETVS